MLDNLRLRFDNFSKEALGETLKAIEGSHIQPLIIFKPADMPGRGFSS